MTKLREIDLTPGRIFVVGDIHGCHRELAIMIDYLKLKERLSQDDLLLFIGDYIDRGPDSKGVIDLLLALKREHENVIFLRGNHEDMFLNFMGFDGTMGEVYLLNGGRDCLSSYDIKSDSTLSELVRKFPKDHLSFFLDLESYVICGNYVFAHAGLDPKRDLKTQMDGDLFWIRDSFISHRHDFGKTVIFGHTPYQDVMFDLPYKIGIDTGLVYGNKLTCLELTGKTILQLKIGENRVKSRDFPISLKSAEINS